MASEFTRGIFRHKWSRTKAGIENEKHERSFKFYITYHVLYLLIS